MTESSTHQPIGAAHDARSRACIAAPELQTLSRVFSENRSLILGTRDDRRYRAPLVVSRSGSTPFHTSEEQWIARSAPSLGLEMTVHMPPLIRYAAQ